MVRGNAQGAGECARCQVVAFQGERNSGLVGQSGDVDVTVDVHIGDVCGQAADFSPFGGQVNRDSGVGPDVERFFVVAAEIGDGGELVHANVPVLQVDEHFGVEAQVGGKPATSVADDAAESDFGRSARRQRAGFQVEAADLHVFVCTRVAPSYGRILDRRARETESRDQGRRSGACADPGFGRRLFVLHRQIFPVRPPVAQGVKVEARLA